MPILKLQLKTTHFSHCQLHGHDTPNASRSQDDALVPLQKQAVFQTVSSAAVHV